MSTDDRERLAGIRRFDQLIAYLRDELNWPIGSHDFEQLTFEYSPEELGIDAKNAAKIEEIKRLRPLTPEQPWGIFFVKFEPKRLPVVALRRILSRVVLKKRASANTPERQAWAADDLLFVSNYGEGENRRIALAHFAKPPGSSDLPSLRVLGWDNLDTPLHLDGVVRELRKHLTWPDDENDAGAWREQWRAAFTLRHGEVISTSKQLSMRLAVLAQAIRDRIRTALAVETESGPLSKLMKAFRVALVHDLEEAGFSDMYAQTIAYGLLSARITDPTRHKPDDLAAHMRTNPFLKELMETCLHAGGHSGKAGVLDIDFDELGVSEVVELLDQANMEAIVRDFGDRNPQEDPVIHFYEDFLAAYDKNQKVSRGVFYTARPVVSYIVRAVNGLLRKEFGLADGLADTTTWGEMAQRHTDLRIPEGIPSTQPFVQILDPATGTGTFLVETVDLIYKTMVEKWKTQGHGATKIQTLWNDYVPRDLLPRLHGYELLMAPYAIAHLKVGLKLYETGYRFESSERARIFLTNALEPPREESTLGLLPALAQEAEEVNEVKRGKRFTVVLGNPPYAKSSSNRSHMAESLVAEYKHLVYGETNVQPLSDDYVKFLALAFQVTASHAAVVGMITNRSYLGGLIHRGMRSVLARDCSRIQIVDLHGDSNVGERPPKGSANENVFDIQQGVAISVLLRSTQPEAGFGFVLHKDLWGTRKEKYRSLRTDRSCAGMDTLPLSEPYWFFTPKDLHKQREQASWTSADLLFKVKGMGVKSRRDHFLIERRRIELQARMSELAGSTDVERLRDDLRVKDNSQWSLTLMRDLLQREGVDRHIYPITYRPFDTRFIWYHREAIERGDARWPVMKRVLPRGLSLLTSRQSANHDFTSVFVARGLSEMKTAESTRGSYVFPVSRSSDVGQLHVGEEVSNIRGAMFGPPLATRRPEQLLGYIYAILHSLDYRRRYAGPLRIEFPRIPTNCASELADELCRLGCELVAMHLMESPRLNAVATSYIGPKDPEIARVGWSDGTVWLDAGKTSAREGHRATSPGSVGFQGVSEEVWGFHIGGYQVCHKWLKDRKGCTLSGQDIAHYQKIVVALNETIRIMAEIDDVIDAHGGWPEAFQTMVERTEDRPTLLSVAESSAPYGAGQGGRMRDS